MRTFVIAVIVALFALVRPADAVETAPMVVDGATTVDVAAAVDLFEKGVVFVDPRKLTDFKAGHIPGAMHLDLNGDSTALTEAALLEALGGAKDKDVVFYCNGTTCMRSPQACEKAVGWGFTNVYFFRDGFPAWQDAGLPVE